MIKALSRVEVNLDRSVSLLSRQVITIIRVYQPREDPWLGNAIGMRVIKRGLKDAAIVSAKSRRTRSITVSRGIDQLNLVRPLNKGRRSVTSGVSKFSASFLRNVRATINEPSHRTRILLREVYRGDSVEMIFTSDVLRF